MATISTRPAPKPSHSTTSNGPAARSRVADSPRSNTTTPKVGQANATQGARVADRAAISLEASRPEPSSSRADRIGGALADSLSEVRNQEKTQSTGKSGPASSTGDRGILGFSAPSIRFNTDPRDPSRPSNAAELERIGVPENARNHPAGPAAAPVNQFRPDELDENGNPRLGTTVNELRPGLYQTSHNYVTVNALDTTDPELARQAFYGFNAPTHNALNGVPNPSSQRDGHVDMTAPFPLISGAVDNELGGHVSTHRGETPEGSPFAINTTTPGRHPLRGHITRSLIEHEGRFYVRTEGVGSGPTVDRIAPDFVDRIPGGIASAGMDAIGLALGGGRDAVNSLVGPPTFHKLDDAANDWLRRQQ